MEVRSIQAEEKALMSLEVRYLIENAFSTNTKRAYKIGLSAFENTGHFIS